MPQTSVRVAQYQLGNALQPTLIAGVNTLQNYDIAAQVAESLAEPCQKLGLQWIFKGSFDKANRSSHLSPRGAGMDKGLEILAKISAEFGVPVTTDIHEQHQAQPVSQVCSLLQLPAFLSRQTDLVAAMAKTGLPINIKKAQFLAPSDMRLVAEKAAHFGASGAIVSERGTAFGYHNLVVDFLGVATMVEMGLPVFMDATHAAQLPTGQGSSAGGRRSGVPVLMRTALAVGVAGIFLEVHPDPDSAPADGQCQWPAASVGELLRQTFAVDSVVRPQQ